MKNWKVNFRIDSDKLLHLEIGVYIAVLGIVAIVFSGLWELHLLIPTLLYSVAVGRELYNRYIEKGKFDWMDIFATTGVGMFIYFLFLALATFTDKI